MVRAAGHIRPAHLKRGPDRYAGVEVARSMRMTPEPNHDQPGTPEQPGKPHTPDTPRTPTEPHDVPETPPTDPTPEPIRDPKPDGSPEGPYVV